MKEVDYYAMTDAEKRVFIARLLDFEYGVIDHRDANTVMAVIEKMRDRNWSTTLYMTSASKTFNECKMVRERACIAVADELHDAVYLAAAKALRVVE